MTVGRLLRGARSAVFAAVCVGLSAAGHVWMSGRAIPLWSLALAFAAIGAVGYALAGRQRGLGSISALMLLGECGQHLLFTAAQGPAPISPLQRALDTHVLPASARLIPLTDWLCGMGKSGMGPSGGLSARLAADLMAGHGVGMAAVHAAAGLLCACWLWRGESALFGLLHWLGTLATPLLSVLRPAAPAVSDLASGRPAVVGDDTLGRTLRLLATPVVRRGPPRPRFSM